MKTDIHLDESSNCIIVVISGSAIKEEFIALFDELYQSDWYQPDMNEFWDFTECTKLDIFTQDILEVEQYESSSRYMENHVKCAFVSNSFTITQVLNEYRILAKDIPYEIRIFEDPIKARTWLLE